MNFTEFHKKVVFVTGAASGIGQAQALAFLKEGATVIGFDQDSEGLNLTREKAAMFSGTFIEHTGDVQNKDSLAEAVELTYQHYKTIDILLNTAGKLDAYTPTLETSEALWDTIFATNIKSVFLLTNLVLPGMLAQKKGIIINMASIAGLVAGGGGAAYTATKHAIVGYTKQLALDYSKHGIRANAIAPGAIQTPMNQADFAGDGSMAAWVAKETPAGRWAQPEEVAAYTLFLASDAADYIHGTTLPIDGGWLIK